jgi:hypothetical protein
VLTLFDTFERPHDLPPKWDGNRVVWHKQNSCPATTLRFHLPADKQACTKCGLLHGKETHYRGTYHKSGVVGVLQLFRCECRHDVVVDADGEVWDMDASDYTSEGSTTLFRGF